MRKPGRLTSPDLALCCGSVAPCEAAGLDGAEGASAIPVAGSGSSGTVVAPSSGLLQEATRTGCQGARNAEGRVLERLVSEWQGQSLQACRQ